MSAPKTPLSRAEMALAEVREATRELNAAIAEAREAKRVLDAAVAEVNDLAKNWRSTYEAQISAEYAKGANEYATRLKEAMDSHAQVIMARLDKLIIAVTNPITSPLGRMSLEQIILRDHAPAPPPPKMTPRPGRKSR